MYIQKRRCMMVTNPLRTRVDPHSNLSSKTGYYGIFLQSHHTNAEIAPTINTYGFFSYLSKLICNYIPSFNPHNLQTLHTKLRNLNYKGPYLIWQVPIHCRLAYSMNAAHWTDRPHARRTKDWSDEWCQLEWESITSKTIGWYWFLPRF